MIIMHSLFDLESTCTSGDFNKRINALSDHLQDLGLLLRSRFMIHQEHPGYNADAPEKSCYLAMEFENMEQAEACWSYIESDEEPVRTLHNTVKSSIQNSSFFLFRDL